MAIADYLRKLVELKNQLVANLKSMGVTADESEKLNTLVPKVLDIETGIKEWYEGIVSSDCTTFNIPDSVTSIGDNAFYENAIIKSVTIPNGVTSIGTNAFYYCTSLASITIPDSVTSIGYEVFSWCTSLKSINILSNNITDITEKTFYRAGLTSITIPDSVTSIGRSAFEDCSSLGSITIPDSVTRIGDRAFYNCKSLKYIYYTGTEEQWNAITKGSFWNRYAGGAYNNYTIHYNYVPE